MRKVDTVRAVASSEGQESDVAFRPMSHFATPRAVPRTEAPPGLLTLEEVVRSHIMRVMDAVAGNRTHAARVLGLDRKTLWRKLRRYAREGVSGR